ncbi:MFS transporter [Mycobacterium sp. CPCC 205372]|uniref:MFS transporter n=1 Tax=Mycobacterium hippophais TaxID=3016340 RepID=A0ABT4PME8_9MYCO|nr:MFS transporter [Mycobacterium hippophais]MCZ8377733.1 MFS transporter [Mycobacterium hippophais]
MLRVLRNRTFAALFAAQVVALLGTGLLTVALGLLAYDLAGDGAGAVLGTALAIKMAAFVFVAPVIIALTHRLSRRRLLVAADTVRAVIALSLPFVEHAWQIYLLIFVLQAASATFTPVFQSVLPAVLVDEDDYTRGLSMSRLAYDLESLLSPVVAAALLTITTYDHLFLGTVLGFVLSGLLVLRTPLPVGSVARTAGSLLQATTLGARLMWQRPVLRALLMLNMAVAAATALVVVNSVVYVHYLLEADGSAMAVLLACYGGGSMVVALALPRLLSAITDRRVMVTGAAAVATGLAAAAVVLATHPPAPVAWPLLATLWVALGAGTSLVNTPAARLLRFQSEADTRTTVFTAQFALSHACFLVTYPLAGWLGSLAGQPVAAAALAGLACAAAVLARRTWPAAVGIENRVPAVGAV